AWSHLASGRNLVAARGSAAALLELTRDTRTSSFLLYDLAVYAIYSAAGGVGLVVAKALLVAIIALILVQMSRLGDGWAIPVLCTALAMLAMGTRFLLQPATVSYFLLTLAFWLTSAPRQSPNQSKYWSLWPLFVLFLVWVNSDRWYVVGL